MYTADIKMIMPGWLLPYHRIFDVYFLLAWITLERLRFLVRGKIRVRIHLCVLMHLNAIIGYWNEQLLLRYLFNAHTLAGTCSLVIWKLKLWIQCLYLERSGRWQSRRLWSLRLVQLRIIIPVFLDCPLWLLSLISLSLWFK
jgi:hypothetical protein